MEEKMLINGSEAIALGAICSGLKFYSGYPMSPSTPSYLAAAESSMAERMKQAVKELRGVGTTLLGA